MLQWETTIPAMVIIWTVPVDWLHKSAYFSTLVGSVSLFFHQIILQPIIYASVLHPLRCDVLKLTKLLRAGSINWCTSPYTGPYHNWSSSFVGQASADTATRRASSTRTVVWRNAFIPASYLVPENKARKERRFPCKAAHSSINANGASLYLSSSKKRRKTVFKGTKLTLRTSRANITGLKNWMTFAHCYEIVNKLIALKAAGLELLTRWWTSRSAWQLDCQKRELTTERNLIAIIQLAGDQHTKYDWVHLPLHKAYLLLSKLSTLTDGEK
jgi:hypothetical protein